jgi:hypothetical protein
MSTKDKENRGQEAPTPVRNVLSAKGGNCSTVPASHGDSSAERIRQKRWFQDGSAARGVNDCHVNIDSREDRSGNCVRVTTWDPERTQDAPCLCGPPRTRTGAVAPPLVAATIDCCRSERFAPSIGHVAIEQCATRVEEARTQALFLLLDGASVPPCSALAARVWLLARTSMHRGEVFQRALVAWVLHAIAFPFFRAARRALGADRGKKRAVLARVTDALDVVNEVLAWSEVRGIPRGAEHWEPYAEWWAQRINDEEDEVSDELGGPLSSPLSAWSLRAAHLAADAMQAASAIACSAPRQLADALCRMVDVSAPPALRDGVTLDDEFEREWGDDVRALVDDRARDVWAILTPDMVGHVTWDAAVDVAHASEMVGDTCERCGALHCGTRFGNGATVWLCRECSDARSERVQREVRALRHGLSPFEVVAARAIGLDAARAQALKVEGYLVPMLREASYPPGCSLVWSHAGNTAGNTAAVSGTVNREVAAEQTRAVESADASGGKS